MLQLAVECRFPAGWVAGNVACGNDPNLRLWLEQRDVPNVLAININEKLWAWTEEGP